METIVLRYGLVAIFLGSAIEGEPFAIIGGVLAHRHWLSPVTATLTAIAGAWCVDQFWFHLSRHFRHSRAVAAVVRRPAFARSLRLVERHPIGFSLLFRFAYGLRSVAPVAIGASRVPTSLFVPCNAIAAIVWGGIFTGAGYLAGPAVERIVGRYGTTVAIATIGLSALALIVALRRGGTRPHGEQAACDGDATERH